MSGTLLITEKLRWLPAGWVFDNAMDGLAKKIKPKSAALAKALLAARTTETGGYLDLRKRRLTNLSLLASAATKLVRNTRAAGSASFHDPRFYPGYLGMLQSLSRMLNEALEERKAIGQKAIVEK